MGPARSSQGLGGLAHAAAEGVLRLVRFVENDHRLFAQPFLDLFEPRASLLLAALADQ